MILNIIRGMKWSAFYAFFPLVSCDQHNLNSTSRFGKNYSILNVKQGVKRITF